MDVRNIESTHLQEWLESTVDQKIIELNVESLSGQIVFDYLLYSTKISRRNDGRLRDKPVGHKPKASRSTKIRPYRKRWLVVQWDRPAKRLPANDVGMLQT